MKTAQLMIQFLLMIFSFQSVAGTVPECSSRPDFLDRSGPVFNLKSLPPMVLIGKHADYYVENKQSGLKIWGSQSFKKAESKIICASSGKITTESFSIYAPTLIDLTNGKNIGDSYWQFHMIANSAQFGIWNKKSRVFSKTKDLESGLTKIGAQVQIIQHAHDDYEILLIKEGDQMIETLSIRFDAVPKIP